MSEIVDFPEQKRPEWIVGPFKEYRVIVEGRMIPRLTANRMDDGSVYLTLDNRFGLVVPNEGLAYQVAAFVANALAIGEGYSFSGAESKERPFAPRAAAIDPGSV